MKTFANKNSITSSKQTEKKATTRRPVGRRALSLFLAAAMALGSAGLVNFTRSAQEVYAEEIGNKNETQKQGCESVSGGQPPTGYTNEFQKTDPNAKSVFRGGTSYSSVGSGNELDQEANDFARPLPYGDTYVDTNKLNWDNPNNFIIDIKDERFVWVSTERIQDPAGNVERSSTVKFFLKEATRTDKLGNTSTSDPFKTGKIVGAVNGGAETFIAYMGPLESYLPNITDKESSNGYTNVIKAPEGSYLYRITYLDAVTLPNGTRGNLVITMKQVQIESSFEVNKNNPNVGYDEDGNELYRYENALIQIQAPNQMSIDIDLKDNDNQWINKLDAVVKTAAEVEAVYRLTNEKLTSGKYTDQEIADASVDQTVRHAAGALLDFDLEVVDSEGNPVAGTISYAAHDLDFDTKQNIWGRSVDDDNKYLFSEGLKIVEGSKSYALVPNYNHANGVDRANGWIPVSPQKTDAGYSVNYKTETAPLNVEPGNGNNADGVRFSSKGITKIRDKNGTFNDVPFWSGQIAVDKGYAYTASQAPILHSDLANKTAAASGNGLRSNAYRKIFYGKLVEGGYTGTVNAITLKDMHDYWLGNGSYKLERTDPEASFDTGFAVLLDATKSSLQWSGSRQSGAGINTTLF